MRRFLALATLVAAACGEPYNPPRNGSRHAPDGGPVPVAGPDAGQPTIVVTLRWRYPVAANCYQPDRLEECSATRTLREADLPALTRDYSDCEFSQAGSVWTIDCREGQCSWVSYWCDETQSYKSSVGCKPVRGASAWSSCSWFWP
jgi:hypothetical protein